jgi:uncharacterized protein YndB with AHSA1/START domain
MNIVKREVLIDAPVARVWRHITDPARIADWLMPNDFEPAIGKQFILDCQEQGKIACVVKEIIPERKLVYSFTSKIIKIDTTVTITLAQEGNRTRVTLIHSGWDALPPFDAGIAKPFEEGWVGHLERLREQIVRSTR